METVHTIEDVRKHVAKARSQGKRVGFVPTMGYLHEGHLSLVDLCKKKSGYQVMSIFVNPMQFNVQADFQAYPREHERDSALARDRGVDLMFIPEDDEMYRERLAYIDMEQMTDHLCGSARPGHFRGVFTVVAKLFNIVQPDVSAFGQKDVQQALSISKMVDDLDFPVEIIIGPTIREEDGLAMSSRNKYLTPDQRNRAVVISQGLKKAEELVRSGERNGAVLRKAVEEVILTGGDLEIDYISTVDAATLSPVDQLPDRFVVAVAVFFGMARLIDNMIVTITEGDVTCSY